MLDVVLHVLEAEKDVRHVLCATRTWKVCDVCWRLEGMGRVLLCMLEVMRCVLLCMLEVVEGVLYLLEDVGGAGGDALCAALYAGGLWRVISVCRR